MKKNNPVYNTVYKQTEQKVDQGLPLQVTEEENKSMSSSQNDQKDSESTINIFENARTQIDKQREVLKKKKQDEVLNIIQEVQKLKAEKESLKAEEEQIDKTIELESLQRSLMESSLRDSVVTMGANKDPTAMYQVVSKKQANQMVRSNSQLSSSSKKAPSGRRNSLKNKMQNQLKCLENEQQKLKGQQKKVRKLGLKQQVSSGSRMSDSRGLNSDLAETVSQEASEEKSQDEEEESDEESCASSIAPADDVI